MKTTTIILAAAALVLGIIIAPILAPVMPWGAQMANQNIPKNGNQMTYRIDAHFIEQMIPHHEDAITMAKLALTKAEHEEIKTLANNIIKSQSEEIVQMKQYYMEWFGKQVPDINAAMGHEMGTMIHGGAMGGGNDMKKLEVAKPFDKEFIEQMIPHHQMAVMMVQMLSRATNREEMIKLADNINAAQSKEIGQMRGWYNEWYNK